MFPGHIISCATGGDEIGAPVVEDVGEFAMAVDVGAEVSEGVDAGG
jgi:hypothetical protein